MMLGLATSHMTDPSVIPREKKGKRGDTKQGMGIQGHTRQNSYILQEYDKMSFYIFRLLILKYRF